MQHTPRRIAYFLVIALGFAWIYISADRSGAFTAGVIPAPQQGFLAPDFKLKTPTRETVRLFDLRGQAVLVNLSMIIISRGSLITHGNRLQVRIQQCIHLLERLANEEDRVERIDGFGNMGDRRQIEWSQDDIPSKIALPADAQRLI